MEEIKDALIDVREKVRDRSLSLLREAVYRSNDNAKQLERQCAKISRALDKAIHECDMLDKMSQSNVDD